MHAGKVWIYYTGTRWRGAHDLFELGDGVRDSIGLATLPLDGFASIEAGPNPGTLTTKPLVFSGRRLEFNLEASRKGYGTDEATSLRVEILDADGRPLPGFSLADSEVASATQTAGVARWKRGSDLGDLAGRTVRLRFHLRNAKLYAFQFR